MALIDSYWDKQQKKEQEKAERAQQLEENHSRFLKERMVELGIDFDAMTGQDLVASISNRIEVISNGIADVDWNHTLPQDLRNEGHLEGDDLLRIIINQNWVMIQQNERIARLLERD